MSTSSCRLFRFVATIVALLCAPVPAAATNFGAAVSGPQPRLEMAEFRAYNKAGSSTVSLRLTLKTKSFGLYTFGAQPFWAVPDTEYSRWLLARTEDAWFDRLPAYTFDKGLYGTYLTQQTTNEDGEISVKGLPSGKYLVFGGITMPVTVPHSTNFQLTGVDAEGRDAPADIPAVAYDVASYEQLFWSGSVTVEDGENATITPSVVEDFVVPGSSTFDLSTGAYRAPIPAVTEAELAPYRKPGTQGLVGKIVGTLPGDRKRYFDRWEVVLVPGIPFAHWLERRFEYSYIHDVSVGLDEPPELQKLVRHTFTDDTGLFRFDNLPPGDYFYYAHVVIRDGRVSYSTYTTSEMTGYFADPIEETTVHTVANPYQCETQGLIGGAIHVGQFPVTDAPSALFASRNDGC